MKEKIIIGTAQLFQKYGISNFEPKKNTKQVFKILEYCYEHNFKRFDTSPYYNNQKLIGSFVKFNNIKDLNISTKLPSINHEKNKLDFIKKKLDKIFNDLNVDSLENLYLHDINDIDFLNLNYEGIYNIIRNYKIKNIGCSIYTRKDFNKIDNSIINLVQVPINILNKEFELKEKKFKKVSRSIFLQGLLINNKINSKNKIIKSFNDKYFNFMYKYNLDPYSLCLDYVLNLKNFKSHVIGFDSVHQINKFLEYQPDSDYKKKLKLFEEKFKFMKKKSIIDPRKW
jgi:aryl-alcohol dehydrogenase-like predicted oxidoreductase